MKTALIGCGRIGFLLEEDPLRYKPCTHYGGALSAGLSITHACDIDQKRLSLFANRAALPAERCFGSSDDLLATVRPDCAIIATWTDSHESIAIRAVEKGASIIVLEKPITSSLKGAARLLEACSLHGARLIVNHERRYDSRYRAARNMMDSGKIGLVKSVNARSLTGGHRGASSIDQGGGPLLHDGTHMIDILRFFFGDIVWVEGEFTRESRKSGFEDRAVAWCRMEGGIDVFLEAGGSRKYFMFELDISGTEGRIVIGNGYEKLFQKRRSSYYTGFNDLSCRPFSRYRKNNCFTELYREVKTIVMGRKDVITSSGIDGFRAIEAVHAIYLSAHCGTKRITLPVSPGRINLKSIFNIKS